MHPVLRLGLLAAWSAYSVAVVLAWHDAAVSQAEDSQLLPAALCGLTLLLLVTSWLHDRVQDR